MTWARPSVKVFAVASLAAGVVTVCGAVIALPWLAALGLVGMVLAIAGWMDTLIRGVQRRVGGLSSRQRALLSRVDDLHARLEHRGARSAEAERRVLDGLRDVSKAADETRGLARMTADRENQVIFTLKRMPTKLLNEQQASAQLMSRIQPQAMLPPVAGWAMAPVGLLWLVDTIERTKPSCVLECGSGTSTVWMALALAKVGAGRLIVLEHSAEYAERVQDMLIRHGVADYVEVRHTPLTATATPRGEFSWYDVDPASIPTVDLLVVDGPPGTSGPHARYPALPILGDRLRSSAPIVVDDMDRPDERDVVEFWLEEHQRLSREDTLSDEIAVLRLT